MADKDTFTVERSTTVHAEPARVYEQLEDFHRWQTWSPWEELDPDLARSYSGPETGVGSVYNWSGNRKAGEGRMEITRRRADEVAVDLQFIKPFKSSNITSSGSPPMATARGSLDDDRSEDAGDQDDGALQEHGQDGRSRLREGPGRLKR